MQTVDYRINAIILTLLVASGGLWVAWLRDGLRNGWTKSVVPRRPVPWHALEAVGFVVINLLCVGALVHQIFQLPDPPPRTLQHLQQDIVCQAMLLVVVPLTIFLWCRCRLVDFGIRRDGLKEDLQFALWGVVSVQLPIYLIGLPLESIRQEQPHDMLKFLQQSAGDSQSLLWIILAVVVMAPLVEELLFRVLLQGALERDVSPLCAILLTSLAFVSTHKFVDWLPLLPLAMTLSYCYYRRRSYLTVVLLHSLFNGLNLFYAVWAQPISPAGS